MALSTYNTLLKRGANPVGEITNISGPNIQVNMIDSTDLSDETKQRIAGLIDNGEISLDVMWDPADAEHINLYSDLVGRASTTFSITWPDSGEEIWTFSAFVSQFQPTAAVDDKLTASVTLTTTGAITVS
jgi:hypothetical protein